MEILDGALLHLDQGDDERERDEDVQGAADQIRPEVAQPARRTPRDAPRQRDRHGHARRGRDEVVEGELGHLGEVRHRRLAHVRLPVGIRRERGRRLERLAVHHGRQVLRIERQQVLQPQHDVGQQHGRGAEDQHRRRVLGPVLVLLGIDAAQLDTATARPVGASVSEPSYTLTMYMPIGLVSASSTTE